MNIKKKILLSLTFIAGMFFTGLYGVNFSKDSLTASELVFDPQARFGQNVNVVGVVEYESLEVPPDMKVFELADENDGNLKVLAEYTGSLPSNLAKGKKVSISGTMVSGSTFEANKIITRCPSKYTE